MGVFPCGEETGLAGGPTDEMVKATDICSTNPNDARYCATPDDIMIDHINAKMLYNKTSRERLKRHADIRIPVPT